MEFWSIQCSAFALACTFLFFWYCFFAACLFSSILLSFLRSASLMVSRSEYVCPELSSSLRVVLVLIQLMRLTRERFEPDGDETEEREGRMEGRVGGVLDDSPLASTRDGREELRKASGLVASCSVKSRQTTRRRGVGWGGEDAKKTQ